MLRDLLEMLLRWMFQSFRSRLDNVRITMDIIEYQLTILSNAPLVN